VFGNLNAPAVILMFCTYGIRNVSTQYRNEAASDRSHIENTDACP